MGCASSKLFKQEIKQELLLTNGDPLNHIVSLKSSTLGVLKLDNLSREIAQKPQEDPKKAATVKLLKTSPPREVPEVIDAVELMGDLEEGVPSSIKSKKSPKSMSFFGGYAENGVKRSPLKFLNQLGSPNWGKKIGGKENKCVESTPKSVLKSWSSSGSSKRVLSNSKGSRKSMPLESKLMESPRNSLDLSSRRRRSLTPLFDPQLLETYEKELSEEKEDIKRMVSPQNPPILEKYEAKCPPGGQNGIVIYTTTLRGIRKTFEECNVVRSIVESHRVHVVERDVSMHSGFKEELRRLMGRREVKVPLVFVKGRLIGGAEEMVRLEEEGKLGTLLEGIEKAIGSVCIGCGGIRFVMCLDCNGSCKVLNEVDKKMVRCGECNENGLIQCPICS